MLTLENESPSGTSYLGLHQPQTLLNFGSDSAHLTVTSRFLNPALISAADVLGLSSKDLF